MSKVTISQLTTHRSHTHTHSIVQWRESGLRTEPQTDRQTDKQTDTQTDTHTHRQREHYSLSARLITLCTQFLFRFMYSGEAALSGHNVLHVLYAAKKYLLDDLVKLCCKFLEDEMLKDNVCSMLNHCLLYDEDMLAAKCVTFIADHTKSVLESDDFSTLTENSLCLILSTEKIHIAPVDMLTYCLTWAKSHQIKQDQMRSLREILGKSLYHIHFHQWAGNSWHVFWASNRICLNYEEQAKLFKYICNRDDNVKAAVGALGFVHLDNRIDILISNSRFSAIIKDQQHWWKGSKDSPDMIDFEVSHDVRFHGVTLCGGKIAGDSHSVVVELHQGNTRLCSYEQRIISDGTRSPIKVAIPTDPVNIKHGKRVHSEGMQRWTSYIIWVQWYGLSCDRREHVQILYKQSFYQWH